MDSRIDLERLSQVFTDHPWLAEAVSNGAWWGNSDGTVRVVPPIEDPMELRAGLFALADALGCEATDVGIDAAGATGQATPLASRRDIVAARRVGA